MRKTIALTAAACIFGAYGLDAVAAAGYPDCIKPSPPGATVKIVMLPDSASSGMRECLMAHLSTVTDAPIEILHAETVAAGQVQLESGSADMMPVKVGSGSQGLTEIYAVATQIDSRNVGVANGVSTGSGLATAGMHSAVIVGDGASPEPLRRGNDWREVARLVAARSAEGEVSHRVLKEPQSYDLLDGWQPRALTGQSGVTASEFTSQHFHLIAIDCAGR